VSLNPKSSENLVKDSDFEMMFWQANFASWEPCHGRFQFRHPWKQYLEIGNLTRDCAYRIDALSGYLNSDVQVRDIQIMDHSLVCLVKTKEIPCPKISLFLQL
jgi:hypothetical protein